MRSIVLALLVACGHPAAKPTTTPPPPPAESGDPTCPLEIPGTSVNIEDTADGGALVFATTGDAAAVQKRADAFVAEHGKPDAPAFTRMVVPGAKVSSQKIPGGAKVLFSGSDVNAVQSELRMHVMHLNPGGCEMAM